MYCRKCGNELKEDDMFCNKCGSKVEITNRNNETNTDNATIVSIIENIINGISDTNYKGIFLLKNKYILTDGFRIITFKNGTSDNEIIEKYKIQPNKVNQNLKFDFDEKNNIEIKLDDKNKIKEHIKLYPTSPYIIRHNDKEYGINPRYLLEAMELTKSNSIWVSEDVLKTYLIKGNDYNYYILPIKLNNGNNNYSNLRVNIKVLIVALILIFGVFFFIRQAINEDDLRADKSAMLDTLQTYVSSGILTIEDLEVDKIEKEKTYAIYRVKINRENVLPNGYIYVGIIKPRGYAEYVITGSDVSSVREKVK